LRFEKPPENPSWLFVRENAVLKSVSAENEAFASGKL
jgi:hypothetical protein